MALLRLGTLLVPGGAVVGTFLDALGTIAAGGVAAAAMRLEQTMGRLTGLGDVSKPVQALLRQLRRLGNRALGFFGPMHPRARFTGIRAVRSL